MFPAISAVENGYEVQAVLDACGSPFEIGEEVARRRMEQAPTTKVTVRSSETKDVLGAIHEQIAQEAVARLRQVRPSIVIRPEIVSALSCFHSAQPEDLIAHV